MSESFDFLHPYYEFQFALCLLKHHPQLDCTCVDMLPSRIEPEWGPQERGENLITSAQLKPLELRHIKQPAGVPQSNIINEQ